MLRRLLYGLTMMAFIVGLSACAKQASSLFTPAPKIKRSNTVHSSLPLNKFTKGPHEGLLGVRQYFFPCNDTLLPHRYQVAAMAQANYLLNHSHDSLLLQGYQSAGGGEGYNMAVAQQRAESVANFLRLQGVNKQQISMVSFGSVMAPPYTGKQIGNECRVDLVYI